MPPGFGEWESPGRLKPLTPLDIIRRLPEAETNEIQAHRGGGSHRRGEDLAGGSARPAIRRSESAGEDRESLPRRFLPGQAGLRLPGPALLPPEPLPAAAGADPGESL